MLIQNIIEGFRYAHETTKLPMDELNKMLFPLLGNSWRLEYNGGIEFGDIKFVTAKLQEAIDIKF